MSEKNLYYRHVIGNRQRISDVLLSVFLNFCPIPRLLLEVFIRKGFGERYFRLGRAIVTAILVAIIPLIGRFFTQRFTFMKEEPSSFWLHWGTWYIFLAVFLYVCTRHEKTIPRSKSLFDFTKYSLASGTFHPQIESFKISGKPADRRQIETLIEPAIFFIAGIALIVLQQWVGVLLCVCSVFYSLSYVMAYRIGDDFILDKIDELLMNEEISMALLKGKTSNKDVANDLRFSSRLPEDVSFRQQVHSMTIVEDKNDDGLTR